MDHCKSFTSQTHIQSLQYRFNLFGARFEAQIAQNNTHDFIKEWKIKLKVQLTEDSLHSKLVKVPHQTATHFSSLQLLDVETQITHAWKNTRDEF